MTNEQKKLEREYKRMLSIVDHASKGQDFISRQLYLLRDSDILTPAYRTSKQSDYDKYQAAKDKANARIAELKRLAKEGKYNIHLQGAASSFTLYDSTHGLEIFDLEQAKAEAKLAFPDSEWEVFNGINRFATFTT